MASAVYTVDPIFTQNWGFPAGISSHAAAAAAAVEQPISR